ncbi:hypothetical protein KUCAC02_003038 [Chaenocephalus aceratus]|uniref:Uncharacterized protein n=1 Tax=Chaenocephalus aceratus TaxID=36190 RepID=A0ACB9WJK3_CHAAC|nr:hypothetical protein KUCAC02_003038 [Chaenocephalus aceratus]
MSSEKPVSVPPGSASSLTDTDSHPPPGSSVQDAASSSKQFAAGAGLRRHRERMVSSAGHYGPPGRGSGRFSNRDIVETVLKPGECKQHQTVRKHRKAAIEHRGITVS